MQSILSGCGVISGVMKHVAMVAGFAVGAAAIAGGVAVQWHRIQPQFKLPSTQTAVTIASPSMAELNKQRIQKETADLQAIVTAFGAKYPGQVAVVTTDLSTNVSASTNGDVQMVSASLYKLFVAYGIYQKIDAGQLTVTTKTTGSVLTVGQCLYAMITVSDNDCGYALGTMAGWAQLDAQLAALGYTQTKINNYADAAGDLAGDKYTSANDVAKFFTALYKGQLLSPASTDAFTTLLKADQLNAWLPAGLPDGTVIAHKTGALYNLVHDAGIVYAGSGDYLIVVMTKDWQDASMQPPAVFADISQQLWNFFNHY